MRCRAIGLSLAVLVLAAACGGGGTPVGDTKRVFVLPHVLETSGRAVRVATGDVNGDGVLDLVTLRESPSTVTLQLAIRESPTQASTGKTAIRESPTLASTGKTVRGAAAYNEPSAYVFVWDTASDLGLCDLDSDGRLDLVVAGGTAHHVGVWRCDPVYRDEFLSPVLVDTAGPADRVATGDVNGDGRPDIVTLDESTGQVEVFLEASASPLSFSATANPAPLGACRGLVLADFDRDGRLDVCSNDPAGDRMVFLFSEPVGFAATFRESPTKASTGRAMAVGDVDGDGWLDCVVVDEDGLSVTCLRQHPDGSRTFDDVHSPLGIAIDEPGVHCAGIAIGDPGVNGNFAQFPDGGSPAQSLGSVRVRESPTRHTRSTAGLCIADLDRDGRLDILTVPAVQDGDIVVAFGSTATRGAFGAAERARGIIAIKPGGHGAAGMCAADFDGDGNLDVAVADPDNGELAMCYFENGDIPTQSQRGPRQSTSVDGSFAMRDFAVADLDRDGLSDLVCATPNGVEIRFVDPSDPSGYTGATTVAQGALCRCVAIGDVNRDGCPDLVVGTDLGLDFCVLRDPKSPRAFMPPIPLPPPPPGSGLTRAIVLADLDGDGHNDVVCIRESPTFPRVYRCQGQGNGFFDVFTEIDCGVGNWIHVATGDVNGDGRADVVVCGEQPDGCAVVQQSALKLLFDPPAPIRLMGGVRVAVGDVNGDGRADLVTSGNGGCLVALQSHDVEGRFLSAYTLEKEACGGLSIGDFNRDGFADVCIVKVGTGTLECITGDPDFDLLRVISLNGLPPGEPVLGTLVVSGDTDGDGYEDILTVAPALSGSTTGTIRGFTVAP